MPDVKVVSIVDSVRDSRAQIDASIATIERFLTQELERINAEQRALRDDVDRLKQGGGHPTPSG